MRGGRAAWLLLGWWLSPATWGQGALDMQPAGEGVAKERARLAASGLREARAIVDANTRLPRERLYELGTLQALLGEPEAGVATITAVPEAVGGRWEALQGLATELAERQQGDVVQRLASRQKASDRAALLAGLAAAETSAGQFAEALLKIDEVSRLRPEVAVTLLWAALEKLPAGTDATPIESRLLTASAALPAPAAGEPGDPQAAALGKLAAHLAAAGKPDAAVKAVEAVRVPAQQTAALAELAARAAAAGDFASATAVARRIPLETTVPEGGPSWQVSALAQVAQQQLAKDPAGAKLTAAAAAEAARRVVANSPRVRSLLGAGEALNAAGEAAAAGQLATQALSELQVAGLPERAQALLYIARLQHLTGQLPAAETTFRAAREVVPLAKSLAIYDAAVRVPAAVGLVGEAKAGLELRSTPAVKLDGRMLLLRTLAAHRFVEAAVAEARDFDAAQPLLRPYRIDALLALAPASPDGAGLLNEALGLAGDPVDVPRLHAAAELAAAAGWPHLVLAALQPALPNLAARHPADRNRVAQMRDLLDTALRTRRELPGAPTAAALAERLPAVLAAWPDPERRAVLLTELAVALQPAAGPAAAEIVRTALAGAREVQPVERSILLQATLGALAQRAGWSELATAALDEAERLTDEQPEIPAWLLFDLAENQLLAGRRSAGRFLLRAVLTLPDFGRAGSDDLARLARVAVYSGRLAEALAFARRIERTEDRLQTYLDLPRVVAGQPLPALRYWRAEAEVVKVELP
ncbi:MAG: hypothetical protein IT204_21420 [Fimbriimonadaceae bacterium]|nr:hypothetical protein [Fimbriimonadaceae bacterium]